MHVTLIDWMPRTLDPPELRIVNAARLSLDKEHSEFTNGDEGLLRSLVTNQHGTPFEKARLEFLIEVPLWVAREWFRHRFSTFNEVSGRYSEYKPKFWIPPTEDVRIQVGKSMSYQYETHPDEETKKWFVDMVKDVNNYSYARYEDALSHGIAREVSRIVMSGNLYTKFMWGIDLRNLTNFLVLRNAPQALREIRKAASLVEEIFADTFKILYRIWVEEGRPRLAAMDG